MEEKAWPIRQQQRRLNLTILDMVKKEVTKLLATGIIYPISDSQWVSPMQVVPKKSGMTVMKNLCRFRTASKRLNQATRKDHFPLTFIDQVLEKLIHENPHCTGRSTQDNLHLPIRYLCVHRMLFGLCNAPSTFQCCMTCIFLELLQDYMEVFMDDFTVYADSFDACLGNLSKVLTRSIDTNLVLNFEKCHFIETEGIMLGHLVSNRGIEVDKSKIDIITSLPNPIFVREVRSFLGHARFYRRFIKNFSKIALSLSKLLQKDELKNHLTSALILQAPNWDYLFELMCDASNSAFGAVLGQRARAGADKQVNVITYAFRTMDPTQLNYTTTEKELLTIVFALDKFCSYLLGSRIIVFSNHAALRFLLKKSDAKPRLIRWMLLL
ncbi:Retrovirus-related Pol polyprotein from transposon 17.6, partial [Mucuna pruriens]